MNAHIAKFVDTVFRDKNGRIVIVQMPNIPLGTWIVATGIGYVLPNGGFKRAVGYVTLIALVIWAALEVWRGSNLFRRILGAAVLIAVVGSRLVH